MRLKPVRAALMGILLALPLGAYAQTGLVEEEPIRKGRWDFAFETGYSTFNDMSRSDSGVKSTLDINDDLLVGLRAQAHFTENVAFGMGFTYMRPDFDAESQSTGGTVDGNGDFAMNWIDAELTWRLFKKRENTPYVLGGFAAFNIADKQVTPGVYAAEQNWEWHVGGGYEWKLKEHLLVGVGGRVRWSNLDLWDGNLTAIQAVVSLGYRSGPPEHRWKW